MSEAIEGCYMEEAVAALSCAPPRLTYCPTRYLIPQVELSYLTTITHLNDAKFFYLQSRNAR